MTNEYFTENTIGAWTFATDGSNDSKAVESNWWSNFSDYRLKRWREELDDLSEITGITMDDICRYLGLTYSKGIGFYDKLPKKRSMYIGIGMALKQPLETINTWLTRYGMKKKLYVKDLEEDLPWIHLICANYNDRQTVRNYYKDFETCRKEAHRQYLKCWEENIQSDSMTMLVESSLQGVPFYENYEALKRFITANIDSFKTAYVKPRTMLNGFVQMLISAGKGSKTVSMESLSSLNSLRGYLDDSMINYLSGTVETINVIDRRSGRRTLQFKRIPKGKRAHISLALALGMNRREIDRYLTMMGFAALDAVNMEEGLLLNSMTAWEKQHPLPKKYKQWYFYAEGTRMPAPEEAVRAVQQMLEMRQDLRIMFEDRGFSFPYLK